MTAKRNDSGSNYSEKEEEEKKRFFFFFSGNGREERRRFANFQGVGVRRGPKVREGSRRSGVRSRDEPAVLPQGLQGVHEALEVPAGSPVGARRLRSPPLGNRRDRQPDRPALLRPVHADQRGQVSRRGLRFLRGDSQ